MGRGTWLRWLGFVGKIIEVVIEALAKKNQSK